MQQKLLYLVTQGIKLKKTTLSGKPLERFFHIIKYSCDKSEILYAVK